MKSATQIKSLGDMKTTISRHVRSAPPREGSAHLEVYLLEKERQRLQTELAHFARRQRRIEARLGEIREALAGVVGPPEEREAPASRPAAPAGEENPLRQGNGADPRRWSRMTVDY